MEGHQTPLESIEKQPNSPVVPRGAIGHLKTYSELLAKWNSKINLVAPSTVADINHRHIMDSAQLVPLMKGRLAEGGCPTILDVGSGAGLPGIILAALDDGLRVISVESDSRKCAFQTEAARAMKLKNFRVINSGIEAVSDIKPDIITSRAFASLHKILCVTQHLYTKECLHFYLKGSNVQPEIEEALKSFSFDYKLHQSITEPGSYIIELGNVSPK